MPESHDAAYDLYKRFSHLLKVKVVILGWSEI